MDTLIYNRVGQGQILLLWTLYINNYTQRITAAMKEKLPYVVYSELRTLRRLAMMISLRKKNTGDFFQILEVKAEL